MSICRGCGKDIIWIKLKSGKSNPVDPEKLHIQDNLVEGKVIVVSSSGDVGQLSKLNEGYISHFATCATVNKFRKEKAKS